MGSPEGLDVMVTWNASTATTATPAAPSTTATTAILAMLPTLELPARSRFLNSLHQNGMTCFIVPGTLGADVS